VVPVQFIPYYSPIVGHWLLILSNVSRLLTGSAHTIQYPNENNGKLGPLVNLANFDRLDFWFVNVTAGGATSGLRVAVWIAAIAMLVWIAFSGLKLWTWVRDNE